KADAFASDVISKGQFTVCSRMLAWHPDDAHRQGLPWHFSQICSVMSDQSVPGVSWLTPSTLATMDASARPA
ncbi:hypothetical protein, partial [Komagataeibacter xylinus]|uniref:hypothetical protein n=1 Tax=Komagataeibacter xylinus TaxID=28448 RepID=UPI001C3F4273